MDLNILEKRIVNRESYNATNSSLEKCAKVFYKIFKADLNGTIDEAEKENFIRELMLYKLDIGAIEKSLLVCEKEIEEYELLERDTDRKISNTTDIINKLTIELNQEKQIRKCREIIELRAKEVNKLPTRSSMKRKIEEIQNEIRKAQESVTILDTRIENRYSQFTDVILKLEDIQKHLSEDRKLDLQMDPSLEEAEISDDDENHQREEDGARNNSRKSVQGNTANLLEMDDPIENEGVENQDIDNEENFQEDLKMKDLDSENVEAGEIPSYEE